MVRPVRYADLLGQVDLERNASGVLPLANGATELERHVSMARSTLPGSGTGLLLVSGAGYFVYLGRLSRVTTVRWVVFYVTVAGGGAQTAEVGYFSSAAAPSGNANTTLTTIAATGSVTSLTSTGQKSNSTDLNTSVAAGTHLWVGMRTAMAVTQPTIMGLYLDLLSSRVTSAAAPGALTAGGPFTGARYADSAVTVSPDIAGWWT
jgi:hypothetical protein